MARGIWACVIAVAAIIAPSRASYPAHAAATQAPSAAARTCAWPRENSAAALNAGDDSNAAYWAEAFTVQSDLRIIVHGRYPDARSGARKPACRIPEVQLTAQSAKACG